MIKRATFALVAWATCAAPAMALSHLWKIHEIFSNADGTIQFIEMHNPTNATHEHAIAGLWIESERTGMRFNFPTSLEPGTTAMKRLLLGTASFAALEGAPQLDFILPEGFFDPQQDTLTYWLYPQATLTFEPGDLPLDGIQSLDRDGQVLPNSPTNYAGAVGFVDISVRPVPVTSGAGMACLLVVLGIGAWWAGRPGRRVDVPPVGD